MIRRWKSGRRFAVLSIAVLLAVLLVESLWIFILSPRLVIKKIFLESDIEIPDAQLLEMLDLDGKSWTSLNEKDVQTRLETYPIIREARVSRVFPDGLRVYIFRRQPLAVALSADSGISHIVIFDEEGYVIQADSKINDIDLPIFSGAVPYEPTPGSQVPETVRQVLSRLSRLRMDESELFDLISEIEFISQGEDDYDLKMYMNHIPIPVLVDMNLNPQSIRQAFIVIDVLALTNSGPIETADIRGGHVVYQPTAGGDGE